MILMPVGIIYRDFSEMRVMKRGEVIKAVLVDTTSDPDKLFFFKYDSMKFFNRNNSKYYNHHKSKVGDSLSFFHSSANSDLFVPIEKTDTDFYTDFILGILFIIIGIISLYYRLFVLGKASK